MTTRPPLSRLDAIRQSRMDMSVRVPELTEEVAARWRAGRPAALAVADADENRFSMGWERGRHEAFPSYDDCWPAFAEEVGGLQQAFAAAGAGDPTFSDCELTYANPVTFEEQLPHQGRLERLLVRWLVPDAGDGWLPPPDGIVADATFPMSKGGGVPGRLSVRMQAVSTETSEQLFGMTLSAQCVVASSRLDALGAAFDVAFDWIVRGYATLGDPVDELA